jgi:site-specific recombinase XerD
MASRRGNLPTNIGPLQPWIDSYELALRVAEKSANTIRIYTDAATWLARWLTAHHPGTTWDAVGRDHLRGFFLYMQDLDYEQGYRNNIGRALQAFFGWYADEEGVPNVFAGFKPPPPPPLDAKLPPVIEVDQMAALIKDAENGRDFQSRRDAALLRMFASTGCRLAEITNLDVDDVSVRDRTAIVTGKGGKQRVVRFDAKCALALDRYLRARTQHKASKMTAALWIGVRRTVPMTPSGVRQVLVRRAQALGIKIHPHLFRHTFAHRWLDAGGAEGDLMELAGWTSAQMLRRYGRSARGARARRAYDRVNVMGGA